MIRSISPRMLTLVRYLYPDDPFYIAGHPYFITGRTETGHYTIEQANHEPEPALPILPPHTTQSH